MSLSTFHRHFRPVTTMSPLQFHKQLRLREARARIRKGLLACVSRGIARGDLAEGTDARALATVFEGLLLGISPMARDGVALAVIEGAIAQVMTLWDGNARSTATGQPDA